MTTAPLYDDRLARRNALVLAAAQAFYGFNITTAITFGGYVGHALAEDKSLSTLPITTMMLGTFVATVPTSLFMQRFGRRAGFMLGALLGVIGALVAILAIQIASFWLFCLGTHMFGYYQSSANYYRFAAADTASPAFRPTAISWALAGGLLAALLAPEVLTRTRELWVLFSASFAAAAVSAGLGLLTVSLVRIPPVPKPADDAVAQRPLWSIVGQPRFLGALVAGTVSYGMMNLVMTATPLAMVACALTPDDATHAIRWHVIGMYLPSFFTGTLIARLGRIPIALIGLGLLSLCGVVALSGVSITDFTLAMVCLGVGWNLSYISATALVTDSHTPAERGKVQAFNDLFIFGFVALCSFLSGYLLSHVGWSGVNLTIFPFVALAALMILLLPLLNGRRRAA